ncbi:MAG: ATP-dependent DNA helicase RecG [Actinomycetota bacterium]
MSDLSAAPGVLDQRLAVAGIPGVTAAVAARLEKGLGVVTVRDLLETVPRRYIDLSKKRAISDIKIGEEATIEATVAKVEGRFSRTRKHMLTVTISDTSGYLQLVWWDQQFRQRLFHVGQSLAVAGRVDRSKGSKMPMIVNAFVEPLERSGVHVGRIIPVHPATQGVTANQMRRFVHEALKRYGDRIAEPLPAELVTKNALMSRAAAIREMHFPSNLGKMLSARKRLVIEELIVLSTGLAMRKHRLEREAPGLVQRDERGLVARFLSSLPFEPTGPQRRIVDEIAADMARPHPMNRLLQGEVGSGKTVVAVAASLAAAAAGSQTAFMAPTEVLAEQHYLTVRRLLEPLQEASSAPEGRLFGDGFEVVLLTGSVGGKERERALQAARDGSATMLIGTHALIQEGVSFERLGLAIVDEQHRFGVHQRISLRSKGADGAQPDTLIMTATPIPRTLALTLYGDLDVSTLDEMPPGRTPVETIVVSDRDGRERAYGHIGDEVAAGRQAFIVCPLVEDSSSLEAKAAESEYERIRVEVFPTLNVGLIHGRMKSHAKEEVMRAMRAGEIDVLVATTVIEVGVDVPNATVMVVEDADRFGLSQLHQLRGRIGRGRQPGRCYLFTTVDLAAPEARQDAAVRLGAMVKSSDGFRLAEVDLEIRGAGQLFGRGAVDEGSGAPLQTGRGDLRFANLVRDRHLLEDVRDAAFGLVGSDPTLRAAEHAALLDEVRRRFADRLDWLFAS